MKANTREQLVKALVEIGNRFPQWRFGQLVDNVSGWADVSTWDIEDEELLKAAQSHLGSVPADQFGNRTLGESA